VQSVIGERLSDENIHIGPSDYVPWQLDNKIAFIRAEGRLFAMCRWRSISNFPSKIAHLAGVAIDAIRC
jgi:myo-inositol-1-phosphate synthase